MEETSSRECALIAARAADERKATDIMVIKVPTLPKLRLSSTTSRKKYVSKAA